jgi:hypothetical protein
MAVSHFLRFVGLGLNVNTCGNRVALRQIKRLMAAFLQVNFSMFKLRMRLNVSALAVTIVAPVA